MDTIKSQIDEFNKSFGRNVKDGDNKPTIEIKDICTYFDKAISLYIKNNLKADELNETIRKNLLPLLVQDVKLKKEKQSKESDTWVFPPDYFDLEQQKALCSKDVCKVKEKIIPIYIYKKHEINEALYVNIFHKPSFEWEHIVADVLEKGIKVYHLADFKVEEVIISYYKRHPKCKGASLESKKFYIDENDNKITDDQPIILTNNDQVYEIIDMAVLLALADRGYDASINTKLKVSYK